MNYQTILSKMTDKEKQRDECGECGTELGEHKSDGGCPGSGPTDCYFRPWATPRCVWESRVAPTPKPEVGIKHDGKKPQLSKYLHPLFANRHFLPIVVEVIGVLKYGAAKYQPDNWTKVEPKERYLDAALRHLSAVDNGKWLDDEADPEGNPPSGLPHVAHAACSVLMYGALALAEKASKG